MHNPKSHVCTQFNVIDNKTKLEPSKNEETLKKI